MKNKEPIRFRDFSQGTIRTVQNSIIKPNSVKLALNMDSDKELGSLVSRSGTNKIGSQCVVGANCYGLHYHHDHIAANHKLFGVYSDGSNNDIYDVLTGTKSLEDDTKNLKTRFCTYLNSTVRINGTDAVKSYNGTNWTTAGAFDETKMPLGTCVIEWMDRIYTAGVAASPCTLYYSSIANPTARTIYWTEDGTASGPGNIEIEQEDGGGKITALEKVPGYLLIFKERTMKRWDNETTFPEDLINVGVANQEAVCRGRGMVFLANQEGVWVSNGSYPKKISKPIQDLWDAIPALNIPDIATYCDESYVYVYAGDITLDNNTYSHVCFKFNIDSQSWDVFSYYHEFTKFTWYLSSNKKVIIGGDKNGQVLQLNTGNTDYYSTLQPITWTVESQDIEFGARSVIKELSSIQTFTSGIFQGQVMLRTDSNLDSDWKSIRNITKDIEEIADFKNKGNCFNVKLTGVTSNGEIKVLGFEIPSGGLNITLNVTE